MIIQLLKEDPAVVDLSPKFKYWVKQHGFELISMYQVYLIIISTPDYFVTENISVCPYLFLVHTQCMMCNYNISYALTDQLNTTVHGTTKTMQYKQVFGQPLHQITFPGVTSTEVLDKDVQKEIAS